MLYMHLYPLTHRVGLLSLLAYAELDLGQRSRSFPHPYYQARLLACQRLWGRSETLLLVEYVTLFGPNDPTLATGLPSRSPCLNDARANNNVERLAADWPKTVVFVSARNANRMRGEAAQRFLSHPITPEVSRLGQVSGQG